MSAMLSIFLLQMAAGCMLAAALLRVQEVAWRYLRLLAIVCIAALLAANVPWLIEEGIGMFRYAEHVLPPAIAILLAVGWLIVISRQAPVVRPIQRVWPAVGAWFALASAFQPAEVTWTALRSSAASGPLAVFTNLVLGAAMIGIPTAAMLLGHRYLTDTGMTIAPLRRMAGLFVLAVAARAAWVGGSLALRWSELHATRDVWLMMMLAVRVGVGLVGTGVFSYMVWDCVRRRSTQSATAIFYLSMVFVFIGELTGQYVSRAVGCPI